MSDYNFYATNYTQFVNINEGSHKYLNQRGSPKAKAMPLIMKQYFLGYKFSK